MKSVDLVYSLDKIHNNMLREGVCLSTDTVKVNIPAWLDGPFTMTVLHGKELDGFPVDSDILKYHPVHKLHIHPLT